MKKLLIVCIGIVTLSATAHAVDFTWSGQIRLRAENFRLDFDKDAHLQSETYLRTRVNMLAAVTENTSAFVQFQDSRTLGGMNKFGDNQSATLNDGANVDLHQAYLKINNLFGQGWGAMGGRFEVNLGNQRLFGGVGWSNVGRSMEGGMLWYDNPSVAVTLFDVKAIEAMNPLGNSDFDVIGAHVNVKEHHLEFIASLDYWAEEHSVNGSDERLLQRFTIGGYLDHDFDHSNVTLNAAVQTGTQLFMPAAVWVKRDISAFLIAAEAGHTFTGANNPHIAAGIDFASGDDDPNDDKHKAFNNLYYTGHKFRGYMDYFVGSNEKGLMDIYLRGGIDITQGWKLDVDGHYFQLAQDGEDWQMNPTKDLGFEFDLTLTTTRVEGATIVFGGSAFVPSDNAAVIPGSSYFTAAALQDPDPSAWGYTQVIINF
ncbi:MAG TPA: alginate export family protein [candidate division Zixibacteria bacterium]|nr:alginate export family protein [candidate division Zixibacteria bacterium]